MTQLSDNRVEEIRDLAEALGERYWSNQVDPQHILREHNVLIAEGNFDNAFDGMLEWSNRRFCVYLNQQERTPRRLRFTAGHEAGHFFIDEHRRGIQLGLIPAHPSRVGFVSDNLIEREADLFSSYLLMPRKYFSGAAKRAPRGLAGICQLAEKFGVSISCAAIRYVSEILVKGVVIFWDKDGFGRRFVSEEWWSIGRRAVIRSADVVTRGSATDVIMKSYPCGESKIEKRGTVASEWFPRINVDSYYNDILHEEAMSLGRYGYITLLYPDN